MQENFIIEQLSHQDVEEVIQFEINLAKETENMDLSVDIISKGVRHILENTNGVLSLVAKINGKPVGDIMGCHENQSIAWITSVYVSDDQRKKGIFRKLFNRYCQIQKEKGRKMIYLYLAKGNEKAFKTYSSLGMSKSQDIDMFGYQFVYTNDVLPDVIQQFRIEQKPLNLNFEHNLVDILKIEDRNNKPLCIYKGDKLVGYAEYYQEYTQWRFGQMINISKLLLKDSSKQALAYILKYIKERTQGLKLCNIRFIASKSSPLKEIIDVPQLSYDVMQIAL